MYATIVIIMEWPTLYKGEIKKIKADVLKGVLSEDKNPVKCIH